MYELTLAEVLWQAARESLKSLLIYLPLTLGGILVFVCGWLIAGLVGRAVERLLIRLNLDYYFEQFGRTEAGERLRIKVRPAYILGATVRWLIIFVLLSAVAEALRLSGVTMFLQSFIYYLPNLVSAVLILLVGALLADLLSKLAWVGAVIVYPQAGRFLKATTRAAVWVFCLAAALGELGLTADILQMLIIGLVALLAIAGGVALGFGGRDYASHLIDNVYRDINGQE